MFAEPGLVALRHFFDDVVDAGHAAGIDHVFKAGMRAGHGEVFVDGVGKQHGVLRHHAVVLAQFVG